MNILEKLYDACDFAGNLANFIQNHSVELYDFFISQKNSSIKEHRVEIENFILPKYNLYRQLDFTNAKNQTFAYCLIDIAERFGLSAEFEQLYNLAKQNNIPLSHRLEASAKFQLGIKNIEDFNQRIDEVLKNLSISFLDQEDNEQKILATLINFYKEVFHNFSHNKLGVIDFRDKLVKQLEDDKYSFLLTTSIEEILSYSLENEDALYKAVQAKLDEILERDSQYLAFNAEPGLIEADTNYAEQLNKISLEFLAIQSLCAKLYSVVANNNIFYSLDRGVKVLTEQNQLLAYIYGFGKMHHAKMVSALSPIKNKDLESLLEVYDWGCGQGLASVCLMEYLLENKIDFALNKITLIEPSEIAIKRAALHLRKFKDDAQIITINKDLDSLNIGDFDSNKNATKVHLFSNILDIDFFSMSNLIEKIEEKFKGKNIFLCVSPHVSYFTTQRLDDFVQAFGQHPDFESICEITEGKGTWSGTNWSRVVRVFKCSIT